MNYVSLLKPKKYYEKMSEYYSLFKRYQEKKIEAKKIAAYSEEYFIQLTRSTYEQLGLNFEDAVNKRQEVFLQCPSSVQNLSPVTSCISEHWTLFAGLANKPVRRILEIGTYTGDTTHYLSKCFPDAQIVTVDLPDESPMFIQSYGRDDPAYCSGFLNYRAKMLQRDNITFIQINSFLLPTLELGKFDLIWVDACHEYPEVSWDVCNAYHMLNEDGWLLCDDIYMQDEIEEGCTNASFHVIDTLVRYGLCDASYILKRFQPESSADEKKRKHVAIVKKINMACQS